MTYPPNENIWRSTDALEEQWYSLKFERMMTTLLATLLERGSIIALLGQIEHKVSKNASSDCDLGVINVDDLKEILNSMGKSDW